MVRGNWKRGHKARFEAHGSCLPVLLPGHDVADEDLDLGLVGPPPRLVQAAEHEPDDDDVYDQDEDVPADPPPLHLAKDGQPRGKTKAGGHSQRRVTITIKRDIEAKLGMMLMVPGRVWAARDPICGGAFVQAEPEIRSAAVELICQSPDLIEFFMGAGGGFMLWLNLLVACQPVVMTIWMHHIAHSLQVADDGQVYQVDPKAYAA
jgi:hypothetical protein